MLSAGWATGMLINEFFPSDPMPVGPYESSAKAERIQETAKNYLESKASNDEQFVDDKILLNLTYVIRLEKLYDTIKEEINYSK